MWRPLSRLHTRAQRTHGRGMGGRRGRGGGTNTGHIHTTRKEARMGKAPKVGQVVTFTGNSAIGKCAGVVLRIYPQYVYDEDTGHETAELLPEREWHVAMRPGTLPHQWPY